MRCSDYGAAWTDAMTDLDDEHIAALYRRTRDDQPTADSDRLIVDAARRAVARRRRQWVGQWLAVAATLVLGVGVGWQVWLSDEELEFEAPSEIDVDGAPPAAPAAPITEPTPRGAPPGQSRPAPGADDPLGWHALPAPPAQSSAESSAASPAGAPLAPTLKDAVRGELKQRQQRLSPSAIVAMPQCPGALPLDIDDQAAWQRAIDKAREQNDRQRLECLRMHYHQRFGVPAR